MRRNTMLLIVISAAAVAAIAYAGLTTKSDTPAEPYRDSDGLSVAISSAVLNCMADLLGDDELVFVLGSTSVAAQQFADAFAKCEIPIPVEPDGGIGDGDGPPFIELTNTPGK